MNFILFQILKQLVRWGVRKSDDYMKNYFVSQYGAIKDVDFSPLFQKLILGEKNQDGKKNNLEL